MSVYFVPDAFYPITLVPFVSMSVYFCSRCIYVSVCMCLLHLCLCVLCPLHLCLCISVQLAFISVFFVPVTSMFVYFVPGLFCLCIFAAVAFNSEMNSILKCPWNHEYFRPHAK